MLIKVRVWRTMTKKQRLQMLQILADQNWMGRFSKDERKEIRIA